MYRPKFICTLTGADDSTPINKLFELSDQYNFVEWGILFSPKRCGGGGRYPSEKWIKELSEEIYKRHTGNFAIHLCGDAVPRILNGDHEMLTLIKPFQRIQLNFNIHKNPFDLSDLENLFVLTPDKTFLTQHNVSNGHIWHHMVHYTNHAFLFDASGGRGIEATKWQEPLPGRYCGYAGGMGPENVKENLLDILSKTETIPTWIDMESKLRTNDLFDLEKCKQVLDIVKAEIF